MPRHCIARRLIQHSDRARVPCTTKRNLAQSRGALAGGFTKDNLSEWANRQWGESRIEGLEDHYVDIFSQKLSGPCAEMLEQHSHPSSAVCQAFFSNDNFKGEKRLLTLFQQSSSAEIPDIFRKGDTVLVWTVTDVTPHEVICTWQLGSKMRGFTMLALDPRLRKIYLGSGMEAAEFQKGALFRSLLPVHLSYSQFLLQGMVQHLEQQAKV